MISFIIPTHNYGHLLERCIKSICKNNAKYIEIVIVNDHSNDNTEHVVKKLKEKYLLLL